MPRIDLRRLILLLSLSVVTLTAGNLFFASYQTQRNFLMAQTLEANRIYALKLASSTENFLKSTQQQLAFSAGLITDLWNQPEQLWQEVHRLRRQTGSFNSVIVIRADGKIIASSPLSMNLTGAFSTSEGFRQASALRQPYISRPYIGANNHLMIQISHPIFDGDGNYLGYLGAGIYLNEPNILHSLLGEHYYRDGSYLYVVDTQGRLIYHQDPARVGDVIKGNPAIDAVIAGETGSLRLTNSQGIDMLTGYAPVPRIGWGVISQRPTDITLEGLKRLMLEVAGYAVPLLLLSLLGIWWVSTLITRPLWQLANSTQYWGSSTAAQSVSKVKAWYYEAAQLKNAMQKALLSLHQQLGRLNQENVTDPLTGLTNRRGLQLILEDWESRRQPFAVLALDIDHFKQVNDSYGHSAGDLVLQHLAQQMRRHSRESDVLCRQGGEEFMMLLPGTPLAQAVQVAERLRAAMAYTESPNGIPVTVSLGVTDWPRDRQSIALALKEADRALYRAKGNGRNRVESVAPGMPPNDANG
ncbi:MULTISPECIES: sensor domain-containing diguanylate cyclase [Pseudomonas]|nr:MULTISPECIES: sensor domain-containing diguanylate cyclase [Pseudomonas]NVZ29461.1 GGDEF domain-containing protein [Pseudomonas gingeri]NVZ64861.1 GGDEF domain-containing protein [Pseudomonas gingeri]NVZ75083.1 GGDEF domain-containing protein [Pseudomonas gingeri]NWA08688.1 GGDEF domain-containing protein [Pseudomonas gingeri]BBP77795.1 cell signaling regulator [Pseudomonas sp. Ost2]